MGTPLFPTKFVLDLGGPFLWADCTAKSPSSSRRAIPSGSLQCSTATSDTECGLYPENTITRMEQAGELAEDIVAIDYVDRVKARSIGTVHRFLFSCAPTLLLKGLASGAQGMLGLGRSRISLPSQLANTFGFHRKFAICLSESEGVIISGDVLSLSGSDISKSLMYTPLISSKKGTTEEYYINVKSVKISGNRLSVGKSLEAKLSTTVPYTTIETKIYDTFVKAYIMAATSMNMTCVAPVAPFGVCFSSRGTDNAAAGPSVPIIDFVLQSEMVKWRIYGKNSMVKVSDEVICLGILDGGLSPISSIVIGGYQLEDNLLEFNLGTSMFGFSSSLLMKQTTCSNFKLYSNPTH